MSKMNVMKNIQGMKAQKAKDRKKKAWSYLFYSLVGARL